MAALVYIAAFAPDKGESVNTLIAGFPKDAPGPPILPPQDGFLFLDRQKFHDSFAADVDAELAAFMADSQVPWGVDALEGTISEAAWGSKPSWYLIATDDRSWRILVSNTVSGGVLKVGLGRSGGSNFNTYVFDAPHQELSSNRWYHVAFTYRDSDRSYHVRVWDGTAGVLRFDATGTAAYPISVGDAPVILGDLPLESRHYDGLLDEMVVFKDVLTTAEIDQIRQGTYGSP